MSLYPTHGTVVMSFAALPSFSRSRRTWTSTVRGEPK